MAIQIQFRRGTATEWSAVNPILALAEMGIETDTNLFKIGNGALRWNQLDYGGVRGYTGSTGYVGSIGSIAVENVLYVSKSGNDAFDGRGLGTSKLTIKAALEIATTGTTIFVKSGDYIEQNPMVVPEDVAIWGDNLRTVTVRPANKTQDLFWVKNGSYLSQMTFKDHESPSAAVAFPDDGSAGVIFQSPYVQNCTSLTTTGAGMRVDGNLASGTKSMVLDAYTQYNQGGIGVHLLNNGYAQLVSLFTICCDIAILCESGGNCSVTNSNSSFGNYGLKADGVSNALYTGTVQITTGSSRAIVLRNLLTKPNIGDAVIFAGTNTIYTVEASTSLIPASINAIIGPTFANESSLLKNARSTILDAKSKIQVDTIDYINETFVGFDYNQSICSRDIGYIINAAVDDMVLNTNYKSIYAGTAYYRSASTLVTSTQKTETLSALQFVKTKVLESLLTNYTTTSTPYVRVSNNLDTVINILNTGTGTIPAYVFNSPTGVDPNRENARDILQANRNFLIEEGTAFIDVDYPSLVYNTSTCRRDMGYIIDAVTYDLIYGGNSETVNAADEYYSFGVLQIQLAEKQATLDTFNYLRSVAADCVTNTPVSALNSVITQTFGETPATSTESGIVTGLFTIVTDLIENGYSSAVTLEERISGSISAGTTATFHQFSLITSSGHTFEWVGAGTNINTALPSLGGIPLQENQIVEVNGGRVYYTSTDQKGDFRIGNDFVINRKTGTITGRTFTKSMFAVMTPYMLAIGR